MKKLILSPTIAILLFCGCNPNPKKQPAKHTDYDLGNRLYKAGKLDSALVIYSRYINNPDDTFKKGRVYRYMSEILWSTGDLYGAEENLAAGIHTFDSSNEKHRSEIGYIYNDLGNIYLDLKQYDSAINYYNNAIRFSRGTDIMPEPMNGKATAFQKMKFYNKAIAIYDSIFLMEPVDQKLIARIIDNRARTKWLQDSTYHAFLEYWAALKIRTDSQDNPGLNASYAHLSDYYEKSNPDSALWYATKMLEKAKENESPADVLEAIDKLISLNSSSAVKQQLHNEYKNLDDSLQLSRDTTRSRFAMIRYDFQKSKADNLVLKDQNRSQRLWMYGLSAIAILIITSISMWYNKRRKHLRLESENIIRESKLKTSQKVHDVVANNLYRIMNELEHTDSIDKEALLDNIEGLYEKSRDISYEDSSSDNSSETDKQVHKLLMAFHNERTKVFIVGNEQAYWNRITNIQKKELQLVLDEMMVNMMKHSQAKNVVIEFKQDQNKGFITYKDDGVGFPSNVEFGNGLNNTVSRIKSLNGEINFGKSDKDGALVAISFSL